MSKDDLLSSDFDSKAQTGWPRKRAIRSAERNEGARICSHGREQKAQPGQDAPSAAVRKGSRLK